MSLRARAVHGNNQRNQSKTYNCEPAASAVGRTSKRVGGATGSAQGDGPMRLLQFKRRPMRCRRNAPADPRAVARSWVDLAPRPQDLYAVIQHCALQPCTVPVYIASIRWPTGCDGDLVDLRAVAAEAALYLPIGCNSALPENSRAAAAASAAMCTGSPLAEGLRAARADLYWLVAHAIYRTTGEISAVSLRTALETPWQFQPGTPALNTFLDVARQVEATPATPGSDVIIGGYPAAALAFRDKCVIFSTLFFGTSQWYNKVPNCAPPVFHNLFTE